MSFESVLQAEVMTALAADPVVAGTANGVFLERPARAAVPYLTFGDLLSTDWSVKDAAGRETRLLVRVHDEGEARERLMALLEAVGAAVAGLPRTISGWQLGAVTLLRSRIQREGTSGWTGIAEFRVRGLAA